MRHEPKDSGRQAGASDFNVRSDEHLDKKGGARVPTPDPKDQTGDPDDLNPAMVELRDRQNRRPTEG